MKLHESRASMAVGGKDGKAGEDGVRRLKTLTWRGLTALARAAGLEVRRSARRHPPALTRLERPADAIYVHGDPVFEVPLEACYYPYGFSYGPSGWHPFVAVLRQVLADPTTTYQTSVLKRFYSHYQPRSIAEVLFEKGADSTGTERLAQYSTADYLPFLPWDPGPRAARGEKGLDPSHGQQGYGPVSEHKGELEFERLVGTMRSIQKHGYRPRNHGDGEIRGYFLKIPGDYRFVIRAGLHRTAALAALGHQTIRVGLFRPYPRAVHLCDAPDWPLVRSGFFTLAAAERYFMRFFREDGRLKATRLGMLDHHD